MSVVTLRVPSAQCDHCEDSYDGAAGQTQRELVRIARAEGWVIGRHGTSGPQHVTCPDCSRARRNVDTWKRRMGLDQEKES